MEDESNFSFRYPFPVSYLRMWPGGNEEAFPLEIVLFGLMNDDFDAGGELSSRARGRGAHVFVLFRVENES